MKYFIGLLGISLVCAVAAHKPVGIPAGSAIYVDTNNGFDIFIMAAFQAKHLDLRLISAPENADYILDSTVFHDHQFAAAKGVAMTGRTSEAAVKLTAKNGDVIWACAVSKGMINRGSQSVAEACAKHMKDLILHPSKGTKNQR